MRTLAPARNKPPSFRARREIFESARAGLRTENSRRLSSVLIFLGQILQVLAAELGTAGPATFITVLTEELVTDFESSEVTAKGTGGVLVETDALLVLVAAVHG